MKNIKWYYPETIEKTIHLLEKANTAIHSGGTGILKSKLSNIENIIDISKLDLKNTKIENNKIIIDASTTFSEAINEIKKYFPESLLIKALSVSASTPLRNRITFGGSIAFSPLWSDLTGPLVALDAIVYVEGVNKGKYEISEIYKNKKLLEKSLITKIEYFDNSKNNCFYKHSQTNFDFSDFTISINIINKKEIRIVLTGIKEKFKRMFKLEESIKASNKLEFDFFEFNTKRGMSGTFIKNIAKVEIKRALLKTEVLNDR